MHLFEHLAELRRRLIYSIAAVFVGAIASYNFSTQVFGFLCEPYFVAFPGSHLIGTGPAEALLLKIKVALFCGAILAAPIIFYQFWLFVAPGLYDSEKKLVTPFVFSTTFLFIVGAGFCYRFVIPIAFSFFHEEYQSINLTATVKISEHLSMMMQALLGFGIVFQMPIVAFFLARIGVLDHRMMLRGMRYALVVIFLISAVLTPPDVLSQFLMAGPLCVLYGLSILIVKLAYREKAPASQESTQPQPSGL